MKLFIFCRNREQGMGKASEMRLGLNEFTLIYSEYDLRKLMGMENCICLMLYEWDYSSNWEKVNIDYVLTFIRSRRCTIWREMRYPVLDTRT